MLYASMVYEVEVEFEASQVPSYESCSGICHVEELLEGVVISAYSEEVLFEVQVEKKL